MDIKIDYYYSNEENQYNFYKLPTVLFVEPDFKTLSSDAKILYSLMLNRINLSIKNDWHDDENKVYIYFTLDEIKESLNCSNAKGSKIIKELENINLIERVKQGQGKPAKIYVKKFFVEEAEKNEQETSGLLEEEKNQQPGFSEFDSLDLQKSEVKTYENQKSRLTKIESLDFLKSDPIKNKYNNNDFNNNDFNKKEFIKNQHNNSMSQSLSSHIDRPDFDKDKDYDRNNCADKEEFIDFNSDIHNNPDELEFRIKKQIGYFPLLSKGLAEQSEIDSLVIIMTEVLSSKAPIIRINGDDKPREVVRAVFAKIDADDIVYTINKFKEQTHRIKHKKAYLLTCLYNTQIERVFDKLNTANAFENKQNPRDSTAYKPKNTNKFCNYEQREWDFDTLNKIKMAEL